MPNIAVKGEKVFYRESGRPAANPTLVFVHGAGGNSSHWSAQLEYFGETNHCLAIDLPGHGESGGKNQEAIGDYVSCLCGFLQALNPSPFILIGHSMGGAIAQSYVIDPSNNPQPQAIVLAGTGARLRVAPMVFQSLEGDFKSATEVSVGWIFGEKVSKEVVQEYIKEALKGSPTVVIGDFRACDDFDIMARIHEISLPALIICGDEDKLTPLKYSRYLHDKISGSRLKIVPEAGHMVMLEKPTDFNCAMREYLIAEFP